MRARINPFSNDKTLEQLFVRDDKVDSSLRSEGTVLKGRYTLRMEAFRPIKEGCYTFTAAAMRKPRHSGIDFLKL